MNPQEVITLSRGAFRRRKTSVNWRYVGEILKQGTRSQMQKETESIKTIASSVYQIIRP